MSVFSTCLMYSDYYNSKFGVAEYAELAKDWLCDEDIFGNKLLKYTTSLRMILSK